MLRISGGEDIETYFLKNNTYMQDNLAESSSKFHWLLILVDYLSCDNGSIFFANSYERLGF